MEGGRQFTAREAPEAGDEPDPKRRKVRKGTRSCWECKRRKIRCTYVSAASAVCDGCVRRGTGCVSQEFPDEPAPAPAGRQMGDRLGRMEALVDLLVRKAGAGAVPLAVPDPAGSAAQSPRPALLTPDASDAASPSGLLYEVCSGTPGPGPAAAGLAVPQRSPGSDIDTVSPARSSRSAAPAGPGPPGPAKPRFDEHHELSRALVAAWPSPEDLDIIISESSNYSGMLHLLVSTPSSVILKLPVPELKSLLRLPPPGSHPILFAKQLLILAGIMQNIHPNFNEGLLALSVPYREIMNRAAETAISLVTSNDALVGSVDGVEAIVFDAMFQANAGNLRRSWLGFRRAMVIAQMMGLHRGAASAAAKVHDGTRADRDLSHMWFRVVHADRHLSLMLALPMGWPSDSGFASEELLDGLDTPLDRMERLQATVAGRVLQRNETDILNMDVTRDIDRMLQRASTVMPPQWWLPPDYRRCPDELSLFEETVRVHNQLFHYYTLMHLHLPYVLCLSTDSRYDYHKITAVTASREILSRHISFRSVHRVALTCRSVDFFAFTAAMTLCLAHLESHRCADGHHNILMHQRLSDRGMMERSIEIMFDMARRNDEDVVTQKSAVILQRMLAVEADAANGGSYRTSADNAQVGDTEAEAETHALRICVPYFGTIKIAREGVSKSDPAVPGPDIPTTANASDPLNDLPCSAVPVPPVMASARDRDPQNARTGYQVGGRSANPDWQPVPSLDTGFPTPAAPLQGSGLEDESAGSQLLVPGLTAGVDDWAFQGMDMAFFDSLFKGATVGEQPGGWAA